MCISHLRERIKYLIINHKIVCRLILSTQTKQRIRRGFCRCIHILLLSNMNIMRSQYQLIFQWIGNIDISWHSYYPCIYISIDNVHFMGTFRNVSRSTYVEHSCRANFTVIASHYWLNHSNVSLQKQISVNKNDRLIENKRTNASYRNSTILGWQITSCRTCP